MYVFVVGDIRANFESVLTNLMTVVPLANKGIMSCDLLLLQELILCIFLLSRPLHSRMLGISRHA